MFDFLAYYVHDLNPFLLRFSENWGIRWYGMAYLCAFIAAYLIYKRLAEKGYSDLQPSQVSDFIFGCAIFGVLLGGRLGYMLFYNLDGFLADPLSIVRVNEGGMSAHGGIFGVALYLLWYSYRHKVAWLNLGDNIVVVTPIGLFFGRIANFINGELYGRVTSVAWAVQFPSELYSAPREQVDLVLAEATAINPEWNTVGAVIENVSSSEALQQQLAGTLSPRHPSQFYEAFLEGALLFLIIWLLRTRVKLPNGILTGVFFIGYAILRSFCELFRQPDAGLILGLTRGQFLSGFLILIGVAFITAALKNPKFPLRQPSI